MKITSRVQQVDLATYSFLLITKYHYQSYRLYYNLEIVNIHWLSIKIVLWPFGLYQIMKFVGDKRKVDNDKVKVHVTLAIDRDT